MKPVTIESPLGLDRLATWSEIRCAISFLPKGAIELFRAYDDSREMESTFEDRDGNLSEDAVWLAIIGEMPDSPSN